ncbi:hypothetical protein AJ87_26355 [Rhizobium yanglingense]|nr:hypothetical protein AJ87_26355 [Rhizobium yanglingense]
MRAIYPEALIVSQMPGSFARAPYPHTVVFDTLGLYREGTMFTHAADTIVDEENPWTGAKTRPVHKHRWLWEKANGPIPEGHVLKCLDGDKTNCDPSNWELISREVLPHLSGRFGFAYDQAEPEVKPAMMAVAKLKHAVKQARSKARSA